MKTMTSVSLASAVLLFSALLYSGNAMAGPSPSTGASASAAAPSRDCTTTREFITALEFLRGWREAAVPEEQSRKIAIRVAKGCTGAAERFIKVARVLSQAGISAKDAMETGIEFVAKTSVEAETFALVFVRAFVSDGLDLDLSSAVSLARSLSSEFEGSSLDVRNDFERLVEFCVSSKELDLPRPQCAPFAARLARLGQAWSGGVAAPFLEAYGFLRSDPGPALPTGRALQVAEELLQGGPDSPRNFIQAFRYAASKKGLSLSSLDAMKFARELSLQK